MDLPTLQTEGSATTTSSSDNEPQEKTAEELETERLQHIEEERKRREEYGRRQHIEMLQDALAHTRVWYQKPQDFSDPEIFNLHARLLLACANQLLAKRGRKFVIDDSNRDVLRFLLLYFNGSPLALDIFPQKHYTLDKNILLVGEVGVGKTLLMDAISLYLDKSNNQRAYTVVSQTQMLNHYKQHNNIDRYTFNTSERNTFEGHPFNLCLNDIGLKTQRFYGNDTEMIIEEFLYARYEIWEQQGKMTHLTTNLDKKEIEELFYDKHGRLADRFKMFNVVPLVGHSRR